MTLIRIAAICFTALTALGAFVYASKSHADGPTTVALATLDISKATQGYGKPHANLTVDSHVLTLAGKTYTSGFGTHAPGLLAVRLDGGATRFTATVGVDDEARASGKGSVEFIVMGDGNRVLWRSGILRPGEAPKAVDVDVAGQRRIILRVTDGGDGLEFDHADWADAQIILAPNGRRPETVTLEHAEPVIATTAPPAFPLIGGTTGTDNLAVGVRVGTPLVWTVPVTGERPIRFDRSVLPMESSKLPPPFKIDAATGIITGTPMRRGDYRCVIVATNAAGSTTRIVDIIADKRVALLPPMGWNSYDYYGDTVNETQFMANATYVRDRLLPFGWDTVVVDYRWYDPDPLPHHDNGDPGERLTMDANGRLCPATSRFSNDGAPSFKPLADRVHAMGLRFGIHIMRGIPRAAVNANLPIEGSTFRAAEAADTSDTCPWCPDMYGVKGAAAAGKAYYDSLFRLYASWGVDYVKMDDTSQPYHANEIDAVHDAILKCGRSIVYSLSPGETPIGSGDHVALHANLWRVSGDFWDNWGALNHEFTLAERWQPFVGPGHWPDADMLPLGHLSHGGRPVGPDRQTNFTHAEQMTLLSLWCLLPSPLMVGANLPDNDPWTLALLTNPEVLAVDQNTAVAPARHIQTVDETEVWARPLADGSFAVGLFNRGDIDGPVTIDSAKLALPPGRRMVRDLWKRKDRGPLGPKLTAEIPAHGAALFRLVFIH